MICKARQYNDEMHCNRCGFIWDIRDPDRPKCKTEKQIKRAKNVRARDKTMKDLGYEH